MLWSEIHFEKKRVCWNLLRNTDGSLNTEKNLDRENRNIL